MTRHIEIGSYDVMQVPSGSTTQQKVGEVTVVAGSGTVDVVEHWILYKTTTTTTSSGMSTIPGYTWPSSTSTSVGTSIVSNVPAGSTAPISFDAAATRTRLSSAGISYRYVRCDCSAAASTTPPDPGASSAIRLPPRLGGSDGTDPVAQIDTGWFAVVQSGVAVGEVIVRQGTTSGSTITSTEDWYLFTSVPSGAGASTYSPPGAGGSGYGIQFVRSDTIEGTTTLTGYRADHVHAACTEQPL
jgi:hypothetical protein